MTDVINPDKFGVSFSIKQCRAFSLDYLEVLDWLIKEAGFRRYRLMSYWNEHEPTPGKCDFTTLDKQIAKVARAKGQISLCLGARQPRWPENHWPDWAWQADKKVRSEALLKFIKTVVERYKDEPAIISYQLENEALLKNFGRRPEIDRSRLIEEFNLIKRLDPSKPIIMTTSTSWGIPIRKPIPDIVGFSYYHTLFSRGRYRNSLIYPLAHKARKSAINLIHQKPVFIHELQLEPWGPKAIWQMPKLEQDKSMSPEAIKRNLALAKKINAWPIDLWGGEWWYWRLRRYNDPSIWQAVKESLR